MNRQAAIEFFQCLYGDCQEGFLTLWTKQRKQTYWFEITDINLAADTAIYLADLKCDVYFGVGLRKEEVDGGRGTADDVIIIPGVWIDIDIQSGAHKQEALPPDLDAAIALVNEFPAAPSILVNSGYGLHAYWKFVRPKKIDSPECREATKKFLADFQATFRNYAARKGWKLDNTSDLARVLRVPGTMNYKGDPREVTIIHL